MLARLLQRDREISVRVALGATRSQLVRQFLTESIVLALVGGLLGLGVGFATLDLLVTFAAKFTTRAQEIQIDARVLLFTAAVSIFTGLVFGSVPALTSRRGVAASLRADARPAHRAADGGHAVESDDRKRLTA